MKETPWRLKEFNKQEFVPNIEIYYGIKDNPGWVGCGKSYKQIIQQAKIQNLEKIIICEDDCKFKRDFYDKFNIINSFLDNNDDWDIFVGVINDLPSDTIIQNIYDYNGLKFFEINKMHSTVFNIYNKRSFDRLLKWNKGEGEIDQFIKRQNMRIITTVPFEFSCINVPSTIHKQYIDNSLYINGIEKSENFLNKNIINNTNSNTIIKYNTLYKENHNCANNSIKRIKRIERRKRKNTYIENFVDICTDNYDENIFIPKCLNFIWVGRNEMPNDFKDNIKSWIKNHNKWKIKIWSDFDINPTNFINYNQIIKSTKMAQKADIMRYEIIYKYGGMYLDTDFKCYKNISSLIDNYELITCNGDFECPDKQVCSIGFFAANKNNDLFKILVDNIKNINIGNKPINEETGPYYFGFHLNNKNYEFHNIVNPRLLYPNTYQEYHNNIDVTKYRINSYGEHMWANSWGKNKNYQLKIKRKYIIFTSEYIYNSYGGVSTVVHNMYESLKKINDVYLIVNNNNYEIIYNNINKNYDNFDKVLESIKINCNDIVIIHDINKDRIYNQFLKFTKRVFVMIHGFKDEINIHKIKYSKLDNNYKKIFEDTYNNYINKIKIYNKLIVLNPKLSEIYNKKYKDKDIIYIPTCIGSEIKNNIYNSKLYYKNVEYIFNKTILKSILNNLNKYINIVYIGRIEKFKNIITIIESIKNIDNISITLIGSICDKDIIKNYDNIIYITKISNIELNSCFELFDITINLSLFEGLPQVVLESGLHSKTCILSNLFGFKELFKNTCYYIDNYENIDHVNKEIIKIISDKNDIIKKGKELYDLVKLEYYIDEYNRYLNVLELFC